MHNPQTRKLLNRINTGYNTRSKGAIASSRLNKLWQKFCAHNAAIRLYNAHHRQTGAMPSVRECNPDQQCRKCSANDDDLQSLVHRQCNFSLCPFADVHQCLEANRCMVGNRCGSQWYGPDSAVPLRLSFNADASQGNNSANDTGMSMCRLTNVDGNEVW